MKRRFLVGVVALIASNAYAQTPEVLTTPTGHELSFNVSRYVYREPGSVDISIRGAKVGGDYIGTFLLSRRQHWFGQINLRGMLGNVAYDGWCSPFLIVPNSMSPNGYELDLGARSPCSATGDRDWYVEARALFGKDLVGQRWGLSLYSGLGVRHLSNGTTGTPGYRTDDYLYLPVGMTARTNLAAQRPLSFTLEFDHLIHGWQITHSSYLGGGDVPQTATAPAFTIDGFTDVSFSQSGGWSLRVSVKYPVTRTWSLEPYYVRWNVDDSSVNYEVATFTVNNVTARQQLGFYEPFNVTNEFGVKLGFRF